MAAVRGLSHLMRRSGSFRGGLVQASRPFSARFETDAEVREKMQFEIARFPEMYKHISTQGIQYPAFSSLVQRVCPTVGERERYALFTSMDVSGDGWIQDEEMFSDIVLRVIRARSQMSGDLHPCMGSYASLPRPPFVQDPMQMQVVGQMAEIFDAVVEDWEKGETKVTRKPLDVEQTLAASSAWSFASLFGGGSKKPDKKAAPPPYKPPNYQAHKGMYLVGTSGSGKTALLNVLYRSLPVDFPVVRLHWHEFCRDAFKLMNDAKKRKSVDTGRGKEKTAFEIMADEVAGHCRLFLLDEMNITAVSEGVLVKEFFRALWMRGVTVLTTSNYQIDQLYSQGYNRAVLDDFFPELHERCPQIDMSADVDYRTVGVEGSGNFVVGMNADNAAKVDEKWRDLAGDSKVDQRLAIPNEARTIDMKAVSKAEPVARFDFNDLCGKPLGRSDYSLIATSYHTVFLDNVPKLAEEDTMEFKRFVSFIDMMYDKKVNLHIYSDCKVQEIWDATESLLLDEQFQWRRCRSMMTEMESTKYQGMAWLMRRHLIQETATKL